MSKDESGVKWAGWPLAGALGAGRHDESPPPPDSFGLTPSAEAEQELFAAARQRNADEINEIMGFPAEETPDARPE